MKTAIIYARYSSDNQTEQSIEGQLRVCNEYAKSHDIVVLDTYIDRAMTGTNDNRPDFQRMIRDSSKRQWDFILVYKLDRFSRNKYEMAMHKKTLKDNGVKVISAMEYIPDSPEAIILESMLEGYAEYYSAELSQKVKRGMRENILKGCYTGGTLLYGYKVQNKKVTIDEDKAKIVAFMFEQYSVGVCVKDIIKELTEKGILHNGKPFARNTVYNMLKNEKYSGIYKYNTQVYDNVYPRIVPQDIYEKVRKKIDKNKYGKQSTETVYLLKSLIKCGYCKSNITAETGTGRQGTRNRYYKCMGRKHHNGCNKTNIRKDYLENIVLTYVIDELRHIIDDLVKLLVSVQEKNFEENPALNILLKEKAQTDKAIKNLVNVMENGGSTKTTIARLKELEIKQDDLEKLILVEKNKVANKIPEKEIRSFYEHALSLEPKLLISLLVKQITLYDDKIAIEFNTPLNVNPGESQGFVFYDKTIKIAKYIQHSDKKEYADYQIILMI